MALDVRQIIYDEWLENSIYTADRQNGRDTVRIRKIQYLEQYNGIKNTPELSESKNKRESTYYVETRRILTCTVRNLQKKIKTKYDIDASLGIILKMKPFFLTYATEKEIVLCMCKLCLNTRLLFSPLMEFSKSNGGNEFTSMSDFFMQGCGCSKSENGYYKLKCCEAKCKCVITCNIPDLDETVKTYYQFQTTTTSYTSHKDGNEKVSRKTERIEFKECEDHVREVSENEKKVPLSSF